jgi:hypothetical protein
MLWHGILAWFVLDGSMELKTGQISKDALSLPANQLGESVTLED